MVCSWVYVSRRSISPIGRDLNVPLGRGGRSHELPTLSWKTELTMNPFVPCQLVVPRTSHSDGGCSTTPTESTNLPIILVQLDFSRMSTELGEHLGDDIPGLAVRVRGLGAGECDPFDGLHGGGVELGVWSNRLTSG